MYYNIEVYSGVLISSEICRAYIYPEVDKFMDNEMISQDKQSIVRDKIYEMIDMIMFEYHKKVKSIIQKVISSRIEEIEDCEVSLVGDDCYDIYIDSSKSLDKDNLAYQCLELVSQEIDETGKDLIDEIKIAVESIIEDELSKEFTIDIKSIDVIRGMEIVEIH